MQITDVYTKKEYDCKKCGRKVYYAKIADDVGKLVTTDGLSPNGKYGKESNVLSAPVDIHFQYIIHSCSVARIDDEYRKYSISPKTEKVYTSPSIERKQYRVKWHELPEQLTPLQSELYHGFHEVTTVAYQLTREQHPDEPEDSNIFGQIVHAKSLVLSNLVIAKAIKNSKPN